MKLERVTPISAFAVFACIIPVIWTCIEFFRLTSLANQLRNKNDFQGWSCLIPIYSSFHLVTIAKELNLFIRENNLQVAPANDNLLLALFCPVVNLYSIFDTYNKCADASNR